jgi:hypothetical protein
VKYASFVAMDGSPTWGVISDEHAYDLGVSGVGLAPSLKDAVAQGIFGSIDDRYREAPAQREADIEFLPAITDPAKIICVGVNYRSHQQETGRTEQKAPTIFTRFADSQTGHLRPAQMPATTSQFDYEGELALVIGKPAFHVTGRSPGTTSRVTAPTTTSPSVTGSGPPVSGSRVRTSPAPGPSAPT